MEKKNFYTQGEQLLVDIAKALEAKKNTAAALALDSQLLELEAAVGLIDGMEVENYGI